VFAERALAGRNALAPKRALTEPQRGGQAVRQCSENVLTRGVN
jgi:hypothetical protein